MCSSQSQVPQYQPKPPDIEIVAITKAQIQRVVTWLYEIQLIKDNIENLEEKLPKICKNGVIFSDLINRYQQHSPHSQLHAHSH